VLDEADRLGITDDTIFIFIADTGADPTRPHHSVPGMWRGS
jgi:arylsulfatase A-like enzyme